MKKIFIGITLVVIGIIVLALTIYISKHYTDTKEPIVKITGADFTLNDIKNAFLNTDYAKENSCNIVVSETNLNIDCKTVYNFTFDGSVLTLNISESSNKDIFKYLVDTIETFYGSNIGDYYKTMDMFLSKNFQAPNLTYKINDNTTTLSVDLTQKLEMYQEKDIITSNDLIDINNTDYVFEYDNYKIDNIELLYNSDINWITFGGILFGDDNNVTIKLQFYNSNNELVYEVEDDLSLLVDVGFPYYGFVINVDLNNINIDYGDVSMYNIELKKVE